MFEMVLMLANSQQLSNGYVLYADAGISQAS